MNKIIFLIISFITLTALAQSQNTIDNDGTTADRWYIGIDSLAKAAIGISQYDEPSHNLTLGNHMSAGSQVFTSGWQNGSGWRLNWDDTTGYTLEIDNLNIRGILSAYEFLINQIRATNGDVFISSTAKVDWWNGMNMIKFEDVTGLGVAPFMSGDIIICQQISNGASFDANGDVINNSFLIKRLIYKVDSVNALKVYFSNIPGTSLKGYPKKGDVFVRIGNISNAARQGSIGLYTDVPYAPYIRIVDNVNSWSAWKNQSNIKFQAGNLNGITDPDFGALQGYGLYTQNAYIKGKIIITNPQQVADSLNKLIATSWDSVKNKPTFFNAPSGSGLFLSATNMGYYNTIQYPSDPWRTYMDNQGRFYLKGNSGNYLTWDGNGLYIRGTFSGNGNALDITANSTITTINNILSTHSTQITQNANEISLRAYQVDMTRAFDTLAVHRTAITQNANAINLKASITSLDSLKNRMSTAEAGISINTSNINTINSNLLLYAKKDSLISYINLSPAGVRISGNKITLDGNVNVEGTFSINGSQIRVDSLSQISNYLGTVDAGVIRTIGIFSTTGIGMGFEYEFKIGVEYDPNIFTFNYPIKSSGYKSADGTDGVTANISGLQFKNGIYVGGNLNASATWGSITGTLSNQTDLQVALNSKANLTHYHVTDDITDLSSKFGFGLEIISGLAKIPITINGATRYVVTGLGDLGTQIVYTTGSYSNPSWITSLSGSKITGAVASANWAASVNWNDVYNKPTTLAGYGITDAVPSSRTITINGTTYDLSTNRSWTVTASSVDWANVTNKPTTLAGYGITDAVPSSRTITINGVSYDLSTNRSWTVTASSVDWANVTNKPTTLAGYGITDAVPSSRTISTNAPLTGGGNLSANRTLGLSYAAPLSVSGGALTLNYTSPLTVNGSYQLTISNIPQSMITGAWGSGGTYTQPLTLGGTTYTLLKSGGYTGTISFDDYYGSTVYIYVNNGLITGWTRQ